MHRRRLLRPPPLALLLDEPLVPPSEYALLRARRRAMATTFEVALPYGTPYALDAATAALDLIDELEDQLTVYRDTSEVSRLNAAAADGWVEVEPRLFDLLAFCAATTAETGGAFDAAAGAVIKAWGFFKREGRVPPPAARAAAMARTGSRHLLLDPGRRAVKFRVPGLELNLGGVGKGYALDRAAELLQTQWGVRSALLHGGGSSVVALGYPPGDVRGWPVVVLHPAGDGRTLGTVRLRDRGFATSAATFQFFEYKGRKLGHLLDPRTGWPAAGTASASVLAPSGAAADALSTAFFVLGASAAAEFCRSRPELAALVLPDGGDARPLTIGDP